MKIVDTDGHMFNRSRSLHINTELFLLLFGLSGIAIRLSCVILGRLVVNSSMHH